ncbi:hypothetical protein [Nocardia sp. NPDC051570]|uniref:hypothetical protein n=1 Tax=Nocardia sp. NPDC051570 TaxID=3364324 RepID=UPI0037A4EAD3
MDVTLPVAAISKGYDIQSISDIEPGPIVELPRYGGIAGSFMAVPHVIKEGLSVSSRMLRCAFGVMVGMAVSVTAQTAAHASAAATCNSDWRGDQVCIRSASGQVWITGQDDYPGAMVYLELIHARDQRIAAGPSGSRSLHARVAPGRYYASYLVETAYLTDTQVESPVAQVE